jgi:nickel/cobalt exporter
MNDFGALLQQNGFQAWLFFPSAILLGALHGLEPGHSKTMMAAFIVAVRGTVRQAVLLGLAATLSHTAVVWLVALGGMWLFHGMKAGDEQLAATHFHEAHEHEHQDHGHHHSHGHSHSHAHALDAVDQMELATAGYVDAHEMAHAEDIRRRFSNRHVTTGQIIIFGLTGGLIPCPGAITVLMLCLQFDRIGLGAALVIAFSIGLALTMVASGVLAALSLKHIEKRWTGFGDFMRKAPFVSGIVILIVGLLVIQNGWSHLPH